MPPQRLQSRRTKGFNLQQVSLALNGLPAVRVTRPSRWGNPFPIDPARPESRAEVLAQFRTYLTDRPELVEAARRELRGKNLACVCALDQACHADIWLALVNEPVP
jgi:hypothetical protein